VESNTARIDLNRIGVHFSSIVETAQSSGKRLSSGTLNGVSYFVSTVDENQVAVRVGHS
jgi:hypothetical protein